MHDQLFDALRKDHKEVRDIFQKMLQTKQSSSREELVGKLHREIMPHMRAEERALYPSVREHCKTCKDDVLESMEEHHAARLMLNELQEMDADDERFHAKAAVLHEIVEHHLKEEENEIFKDIRKNMSKEEAGDILERFKKEKERVKGQLH
ncbi:MAG: hemerythrin domain-containing protein [Desulfuromonadales bacterium]